MFDKKYDKSIHLVCSPRRQTDEAHSLLEVGLAVELEQGDVVVQRLTVVVVVDVGGGHPQGLSPRGPVLLSQIVVTNADIDGVTSPDDAEKKGGIIRVAFYDSHSITRIQGVYVSDFLTFQGYNEMECKIPQCSGRAFICLLLTPYILKRENQHFKLETGVALH